jgi:hypothetical protein
MPEVVGSLPKQTVDNHPLQVRHLTLSCGLPASPCPCLVSLDGFLTAFSSRGAGCLLTCRYASVALLCLTCRQRLVHTLGYSYDVLCLLADFVHVLRRVANVAAAFYVIGPTCLRENVGAHLVWRLCGPVR